MEGQIRVMKDALEWRLGEEIKSDDNILAWLVELAGVLVNRYEVGHDGKTPYERLTGSKSKLLGLEFGEVVNFRRSRVGSKMAKLDSLWDDGVFLGYRSASGEIIIGTKDMILRTRTVKRKVFEQRWDAKILKMIGGVPWKTTAGADEGDGTMPAIAMPLEMPEVIMRPEFRTEDVIPRRLAIRVKDVSDFGATVGCKGCVALLRGARGIPHTEACRTRLTKEVEKSDDGRGRAGAARQRETDFYEANIKSTEEKKRKLKEEQGGAEHGIEETGECECGEDEAEQ